MADPVLERLRDEIMAADRALVETINTRLELVAEIRRHKQRHDLPFLDPAREEWMLAYLSRANRGPLSAEGLAEIYALVLDVCKRETGDATEPAQVR
jgi:chorismate mutase